MNLYNYWCASTAQIALNILIKHKGKVIDAAFNLFGLLFCILVFVNIIFYTVEMMVW